MNKLFVYGTLRNGASATHYMENYLMFEVKGGTFDFPVIQEGPDYGLSIVYGNVVEVTDEELKELDKYEGVDRGLYKRELRPVHTMRTTFPLSSDAVEDMWVYVGGPQLVYDIIPSGSWEK